ncbi:YdcF family protein [Ruminococcaceae bacterium OttesenSCG-928-D13]|nr:YdcF family protein [Ruminococcaceae bacterium OttesenSCG-928-D13]
MPYLLAATLVLLLVFLFAALRNPARMRVGFLCSAFVVMAGLSYLFFALSSGNAILEWTIVLIAIVVMGVLMFGIYVLIALLLLNFRVMRRRERRSMANRLTLFFSLLLIGYLVLSWAVVVFNVPRWLGSLYFGLTLVVVYYFFHIFVFLLSDFLCVLARPRKNKDYVIVLGASLVDGRPSPLLARRIDAALRFYRKQAKKRAPPTLIMSGGQGADEAVSEAEAMRNYAIEQGVPPEHILLEGKSRNTYENMLYSKEVIERDRAARGLAETPYKAIFATSGYHILRSGMLARKVGLAAVGIAGRTALYYRPTALLREYVAYVKMRLKPLLIIAGLIFLAGTGMSLLSWALQSGQLVRWVSDRVTSNR